VDHLPPLITNIEFGKMFTKSVVDVVRSLARLQGIVLVDYWPDFDPFPPPIKFIRKHSGGYVVEERPCFRW